MVRPDNEVPGSVALDATLASSSDLAVFVSGMRAFRNGVEFAVEVRARNSATDPDRVNLGDGVLGEERGDDRLLLGVEFADGRWCTNVGGYDFDADDTADRLQLWADEGSADARTAYESYFLSPLPPPGDLRIVCGWPRRSLPETVTTVPAETILEGSRRARELWPWEPEVSSPEEPMSVPDLSGTEWFAERLARKPDQ